jgi:hypothetical protein
MSSTFNKLVSKLIASAKSTSGSFDGPEVKFKESTYHADPPCLLASMRTLQTKDHLIRKTQFPPKSGRTPLTFFQLQQRFNESLGIKSEDSNSFLVKLLKAILSSCVKPHNKGFPGSWTYSNRKTNNVKSDSGLLNILGWTEKVSSNHKLLDVIFNTVDFSVAEIEGKQKEVNHVMTNIGQKGRDMSFQEFRTAVFLTLPRIDPGKENLELQSKIEPLEIKNPKIADNYSNSHHIIVTQNLNTAFAFKVNLSNPKSKTNLKHYSNARGKLINATSNKELVDANGTVYEKFADLPEKTQNFFRKKYRYPIKNKRVAEEAPVEDGVPMDTDQPELGVQTRSSLKRVRTITKGTSRELRKASANAEKKK